MIIDIDKISGIGEFSTEEDKKYRLYKTSDKVFLVLRSNTIELRCDPKLKDLLVGQYESVMESRYFGRGGIEIVTSGQLTKNEIEDLIRLSYNLSLK